MYVAMAYFVFMEAKVFCLIHRENIPHGCNPCFPIPVFSILYAGVRKGHVGPGLC